MKFELHCLYWENANPELVRLHRECLAYLGIDLIYTRKTTDHGRWLDSLARDRLPDLDAIGFIDIDCLPYSAKAVSAAVDYAVVAGSFIGLAQAANHIIPQLPIYAAPSFLVLSRAAFESLGRPVLRAHRRVDVAQDLSLKADAFGFSYRVLYPTGYTQLPEGGAWRLGNYGWYGIGTEYQGGFFHLFESRYNKWSQLFRDRARAIMEGGLLPPSAPIDSVELAGSIVPSARSGKAKYHIVRNVLRQLCA